MTDDVLYEVADRIATVTINRPSKLNALHPPLMEALSERLRRADEDPEVSVLILTGAGRHFGAGYDLNHAWGEHYGRQPMGMRRMLKDCVAFEFTPWDCSKPVIAMVRGYCLAGSCELAMMCCITYAGASALFGEPEIRFSTAPPALVMPWLVGLKRARELLYTGDTIDAGEAWRIGMVNKVFEDDRLEEETRGYARRCAAVSLEGLQTTKASINRGAEIAGIRAAIDLGVELGAILDSSETDIYREFEAIKRERGLTAAIRWRDSRFG